MNIQINIQKIAKDVLLNESNAIKKTANFIDHQFELCVNELLITKGRVVVTGIGKSAIIANKMVATFNSTGTPSLFMHAADAIHGDLGMITSDDIVICLSKSGNTPEIKVLVPLIKRANVKLIALVSNVESYLAKQADFVLNGTIEDEACPNNLAPTTSTTVHLALGDALAVCLLKSRNFSSEDFARFHPGGALGKRLYLTVDDLVVHNEKPIVNMDSALQDVILEISSKRLGCAAVINNDGNLAGIITDGDLRRMLQNGEKMEGKIASDIMSKNPKVMHSGDFAVTALEVMQSNSITQVIVLKDGKVIGFVHLHDLLKEGIV